MKHDIKDGQKYLEIEYHHHYYVNSLLQVDRITYTANILDIIPMIFSCIPVPDVCTPVVLHQKLVNTTTKSCID